MYICMYKWWAIKSSPCTATFNDVLYFLFSMRYTLMADYVLFMSHIMTASVV
jgi:hypothetical protein